MFDIYLTTGCKIKPDLEDLCESILQLKEKVLLEHLMEKKPGFLGLDLPLDTAKKLLSRLKYTKAKASGRVIAIRYRKEKTKFTAESAYKIAEKAIKEMQAEYPNVTFSPVTYAPAYSTVEYLTYVSVGDEWVEEGRGLFVHIDILDGHIWANNEGDELSV